MKTLLKYIFTLNFKALFVANTNDFFVQAFRYVFVGGIAFVADAGSLYLFSLTGTHYLVCTAVAFLIGLAVNYTLAKFFVFTQNAKTSKVMEFIIYGVIGLMGLGLTELLMWLLTDGVGLFFMISKIVTATIVLAWNFIARKLVLYKNGGQTVK
jgi:putative flippase GtrA